MFMQTREGFTVEDVSWFRIGYEDGRRLSSFNPPKLMKVAAASYARGFIEAQKELTLVL